MPGTALIRSTASVFWELRGAWATGKRISLSLDSRCDRERIEGFVSKVAATDAFVRVGGVHVPSEVILAVHHPSRLGDSDFESGAWAGMPRRWRPQEEELPL